jgi:hypothetical protein
MVSFDKVHFYEVKLKVSFNGAEMETKMESERETKLGQKGDTVETKLRHKWRQNGDKIETQIDATK